jgi:hypothetical protein
MRSLLEEMEQCKSVKACIEFALIDAYGEHEWASAWLACVEEMFGHLTRVKVLGLDVALEGFDLSNGGAVVAVCRLGRKQTRVALESVEFSDLTPVQARWLKAWQKFAHDSR